jgi:hypothetical protein
MLRQELYFVMEGAKLLYERETSITDTFWVTMLTFQAFRRVNFHKKRGFLGWLSKTSF